MNRPDVYERSVSALIRAFLDETLASGDCNACAVGNLCAAALGTRVVKNGTGWYGTASGADNSAWVRAVNKRAYRENADGCRDLIDATGYSLPELDLIESKFEGACSIWADDYDRVPRSAIIEDQYRGLLAVFRVLQQIHEVDETDAPARLMEARENLLA